MKTAGLSIDNEALRLLQEDSLLGVCADEKSTRSTPTTSSRRSLRTIELLTMLFCSVWRCSSPCAACQNRRRRRRNRQRRSRRHGRRHTKEATSCVLAAPSASFEIFFAIGVAPPSTPSQFARLRRMGRVPVSSTGVSATAHLWSSRDIMFFFFASNKTTRPILLKRSHNNRRLVVANVPCHL